MIYLLKGFQRAYKESHHGLEELLIRGGDLIAIICHFLSFHMDPSVLYSSLVIQDRLKKNF